MDYGRNGWKLLCLLIVVVSCQSFADCQTKPLDVATTLEPCQQLLDKDDLVAANDCYGKAILRYPLNAAEISKHGQDVVFKKCVELQARENYETKGI